ncbi:MAG: PEP-CTERM sorting domain-containing protein [Syntrophobacteraceae bacterium]
MKAKLFLVALVSVLAFAVPVFATPVDLTFTGVTDSQGASAFFPGIGTTTASAGYYHVTISGIGDTYGFCVDPAHTQGTTLQYNLMSIAEGSVYEKAAYLLANSTTANAAATQVAVWKLTIPGFQYFSGVTGDINGLYNLANNLTAAQLLAFDQSGYSLAVNPLNAVPSNGAGAQDFLVRGSLPVPEPGTLLLLGFGLIGVGVASRFKHAECGK